MYCTINKSTKVNKSLGIRGNYKKTKFKIWGFATTIWQLSEIKTTKKEIKWLGHSIIEDIHTLGALQLNTLQGDMFKSLETLKGNLFKWVVNNAWLEKYISWQHWHVPSENLFEALVTWVSSKTTSCYPNWSLLVN